MRHSQRPAFSSLRGPTRPRERRAGNLRGGCHGVSPRDNRRPPLNHLLLAHWMRCRLLATRSLKIGTSFISTLATSTSGLGIAGAAFRLPQPAAKNTIARRTARTSRAAALKRELRISGGRRWGSVRMSLCWFLQFLCHVIHRLKSQLISALVHLHSISKRDHTKTVA